MQASSAMMEIDPSKVDYEDIGEYCYGKICGYIVKIAVILINVGSTISYMIILGSMFMSVFYIFFGANHWTSTNRFFVTIILAGVVILLSCTPKIADLKFVSFLSIACVCSFR